MPNYKLTFSYDGSDFSGYELQPGKRTIRGEVEKALYRIFKQPVKIYSSSRTDSGVHALGNVISFTTKSSIPPSNLQKALNAVLPDDIRIVGSEIGRSKIGGKKEFNARFDAKSKTYEYLIYNGEVLPPHLRKLVWHVKPKLNLAAMKKAAKYLVGKHDFSSFCAAGGDDSNFIRILHSLDIGHWKLVIFPSCKSSVVSCKFSGNGFLYKMVRNLVGTLVDVGLGKTKPETVKEILKAKNRRLAGRTAPAQGLCLVRVKY
ncbi:MAG: tRNA pseudouridine(38-40) synthase TruA [bacterium]